MTKFTPTKAVGTNFVLKTVTANKSSCFKVEITNKKILRLWERLLELT